MERIGQKIKELRKKNDMTQETLADFLGVTYKAVSKWECGVTVPDLALIVPLARLLHVSTDDLLGMQRSEEDIRKVQYDELYQKEHHPEQLELAKRAAAEYPGELKYVFWQADCMFMLAYRDYSDQESFYHDLEKALKLYLVVFDHTCDSGLKMQSNAQIVLTLSGLKRFEEAKAYAERYPVSPNPDIETVMGWALTGEDALKHRQQQIKTLFDEMLRIMIEQRDDCNPNLKKWDHLLCAENLIQAMIPDENYLSYYDYKLDIAVYKAQILQHADPEKAITSLLDAKRYALEFDSLFMDEPVTCPFTSPYFDRLEYSSEVFFEKGTLVEEKRIEVFKWWLSGECFAPLCDREDFKVLLA